jgi:hypothetical protein
MRRLWLGRLWLAVLCLYAFGMALDFAGHLRADAQAGRSWSAPASLTVAFSASLFWPLDLVARFLLAR